MTCVKQPSIRPEKVRAVELMSARMAHALHGLLVASIEHKAPVTSAEVCVHDFDAMSPRGTAQSLRRAAESGYCVFTGKYWAPLSPAYELRYALEDRALRDEDAR